MENPIVRRIVGVLAGIVVGFIVVAVVESIGHTVFPPPADLDLSKPDDLARLMKAIPLAAKIAVVVAWFLGAFAGAATAMWVAKEALPGWIVTALLIAAGLWTTQLFPHPVWMVVAAIALPVLAALFAKRLMAARLGS
ncbi:hypothetical protein [Altererythrobacter sp. ZODW24]|uniref:hypothetical protein n=1 Tax=Altererythrobacter sp. ZODW24 TaxID=2185142 RepID=UPI000DF728A0|nr:hypothetical protein [Altererythrobacter sp. ZODW24]